MKPGRASGTHTQAVRCIRLVRLLDCGGKFTLAQLAADHGASLRTMRRDVDALIAAGEPIAIVHGTVGRRRGPNLNPASAVTIASRHAARDRKRGFDWICICPPCRLARAMAFEPSLADAAE